MLPSVNRAALVTAGPLVILGFQHRALASPRWRLAASSQLMNLQDRGDILSYHVSCLPMLGLTFKIPAGLEHGQGSAPDTAFRQCSRNAIHMVSVRGSNAYCKAVLFFSGTSTATGAPARNSKSPPRIPFNFCN